MGLENRVVLITGATGGLGRMAARHFSESGARLVLVSKNRDKLQQLSVDLAMPPRSILTVSSNLTDSASAKAMVQKAVEKFGRVDVLLHLVGGWFGGQPLVQTEEADIEAMLQQHLWTTYHVLRALVPHMTAQAWGRIVVVSSPVASRPEANLAPYAVGKAGEEALVLTLAEELKGTGVTANLLLVKSIDVKHERTGLAGDTKADWTTPEEITGKMLHLCSEEAAAINGARIPLVGVPQRPPASAA